MSAETPPTPEPTARWLDYPGGWRVERFRGRWRLLEPVKPPRGGKPQEPRWKWCDSFADADEQAREKSRKWAAAQRRRGASE